MGGGGFVDMEVIAKSLVGNIEPLPLPDLPTPSCV
jgi:hypothetical protein